MNQRKAKQLVRSRSVAERSARRRKAEQVLSGAVDASDRRTMAPSSADAPAEISDELMR